MQISKSSKLPSLGIPLTLASVGTIASLFANKNLHVLCGTVWLGLSLWHGYQHRKKLEKDIKSLNRYFSCNPASANDNSTVLEKFLKTINIVSFLDGRIRVRSWWFVNNDSLCRQAEKYISSFSCIKTVKANALTGSLLIEYSPEELRRNPKLALLAEHVHKVYR